MDPASVERFHQLRHSLTNHTPDRESIDDIETLRAHAKEFAGTLCELCPTGREREIAITHLETTVMWAVKSIILDAAVRQAITDGTRDTLRKGWS